MSNVLTQICVMKNDSNNITLILNSIAAKSIALYAAEKGSAAKIEK